MDYKKLSLRMVGLIGLFVFSALLGFTYSIPKTVEESAKNFVKRQIEQEVKIKYQLMAESDAATHALKLATLLGVEEDQLRADLNNDLPKKIASIVAQLCGYDCEKKKKLAISLTNSTWDKVKGLQVAQINLTDLVKGEYLKILGNLKLDHHL